MYVPSMAKMIQLRNVPDELHRLLKARAALEGMSLSEYLLAEIRRSAERPTLHELQGRSTPPRGLEASHDLTSWPITRYPHDLFLSRIWALRHNLTAYDAAYVALAETLEVTLVTCDARLAASSGHRATIALV
jgi:predicted nucleic acid-binding protein